MGDGSGVGHDLTCLMTRRENMAVRLARILHVNAPDRTHLSCGSPRFLSSIAVPNPPAAAMAASPQPLGRVRIS